MSDEKRVSHGSVVREFRTTAIDFLYRNAVPSHSPGLAHRAYPGITRPAIINPNGVVSSCGITTPRRTQPRWGKLYHHTPTPRVAAARQPRALLQYPVGINISTATRFHPIAQGCASRYPGNMTHRSINPDGVVSSSGFTVPRRTQPRWGIIYLSAYSQGSRCAATLGFVTISRWDIENGGIS